jgi:hypothetical protein
MRGRACAVLLEGLLLGGGLAACAQPRAAAVPPPGDAPAWHVLYGTGTRRRPGALQGPECRLQADGQQVCGHHCRTGRDGKVACAATAEGTCEVGTDGRARCAGPAPPTGR